MDVWESGVRLPPRHAIDYAGFFDRRDGQSSTEITTLQWEHLPRTWRDAYVAAVGRPTNIVRFRSGSFECLYDFYSGLESAGEVPYDQTVEDRVVAVFGASASDRGLRDLRRARGWAGTAQDLLGINRDKGHFIARCIGGEFDLNVFSQDRDLNRGWSSQGKIYRVMERYCQEHPGTFCFSRPIYGDNSSVPRWLEFGLLKGDETLWVEAFDNIPGL